MKDLALDRKEVEGDKARSGGFYTLYDERAKPRGDTNTESTSYALLALDAYVKC